MSEPARDGSPPTFRSGELRDPALTAALRTLELTVRRRLDGVLHGDHLGLIPGPGSEPGDAREYQPGDDVRQMDWSVTARTTHPHVRQTVADRELETWLAVDLSASLDFGTAACEKRDLVVAAVAAIAHLTIGGGNRIGAVVSTGRDTVRIPARGGRAHAQSMLRTIATIPHPPDGTRGDLRGVVEALRRPQRRRGLAVVISDFLGPLDWQRSLRALSGRHDLLAVEVLDRRDLELPDLGDVVLHDPETGRTREFTTTPQLRADYAQAAAEHRAAVQQAMRSCGAPMLSLRTDRDWISDVVRFVAARRHSYAAGGVGRVGR
ncbi:MULTISPECIES: DUF58 domain-containing protein [unclassified Rhodococcus (in: high G+C Gram-positive bacteria)]|uniref:DUF58 domain-containing protein n=1 Tax=unclassified Rhodococcus (in: high G+C Gram-positive bacteria) TaxID=192944 RepID=UPI00146CFF7D|nr:DUF58 domain-containing protein [Rhodococcus sp. (in: high G+C Gram-positive bacteria)]MBF0660769.1 DUF58 domain-containing protein [Rhodococcus sp. (in: high G+C Gram-positive bacteria)]NMD96603.1 DUF58 domain-containing protein [Rhodococcus sp. BL-253-APC-6A1W]NME79259.1 DUF58 domain-containing protein [Rhodococcus sp. 105337]